MVKVKPKLIFARDKWTCALCANEYQDGSLVPHHRANRGMGSNPQAESPANVLSLCSLCNGLLESDAVEASRARRFGIKISKFDAAIAGQIPVAMPDANTKTRTWLVLDNNYKTARASEAHLEQIERMEGN
jgi:hypothetical protein